MISKKELQRDIRELQKNLYKIESRLVIRKYKANISPSQYLFPEEYDLIDVVSAILTHLEVELVKIPAKYEQVRLEKHNKTKEKK